MALTLGHRNNSARTISHWKRALTYDAPIQQQNQVQGPPTDQLSSMINTLASAPGRTCSEVRTEMRKGS